MQKIVVQDNTDVSYPGAELDIVSYHRESKSFHVRCCRCETEGDISEELILSMVQCSRCDGKPKVKNEVKVSKLKLMPAILEIGPFQVVVFIPTIQN